MSITRRVQTLLCSLALSSACFLPSSLARQAKPTATPPQQPQQKSLPTGPLAAPHSTHYPILLLGFGNQPNWNLRIGLKGPERLDRDGYPPIPLEPGEVTQDAAPESWTYHAKDSATGAPAARSYAIPIPTTPCRPPLRLAENIPSRFRSIMPSSDL